MNVSPGSAFFQTVQGSAVHTGTGAAAPSVQAPSPAASVPDRQQTAPADLRIPQNLRAGPPGTNLNIVV
jgi:hypothetical protein